MNGLSEFLHMGGYGAYVWSAYAIAAVVLAVNAILPRRAEQSELAALERQRQARRRHDDAAA